MKWAAMELAKAHKVEEAAYLINRIAELGHFGRVVGDGYFRTWCGPVSAWVLLDLYDACDRRTCRCPAGHQPHHPLRDHVLAGWALVVFEMSRTSQGVITSWVAWLRSNRLADALAAPNLGISMDASAVDSIEELVRRLLPELSWVESDELGSGDDTKG